MDESDITLVATCHALWRRDVRTGILRLDWVADLKNDAYPELSWRARTVAFALNTWADRDGVCWPSTPTIASALGLSEKTVKRGLDELKAARLIGCAWELRPTRRGRCWVRVCRMQLAGDTRKTPPETDGVTDGPLGLTVSLSGGASQSPELDREHDNEHGGENDSSDVPRPPAPRWDDDEEEPVF
jgi:hypothetical protein